ncbi:hypothetical protein D5R81_18650 [Parashewanella spongiae]|uniref:Uncharacterized protein n=1 Tax=Parashewanella spongiae TaxID=342950 RepID=A0A3A6TUQ3_9GAMM|nr:hypothetical protein [Parashewanella spongiae]MCL1080053.1 hypothetical protein [Parashewanella spongiae]RJY05213.1 hypothetical protein D5R81_18650 [Parashewanella spongiae]
MNLPPLLIYDTVAEYKRHYEKHYQRAEIITFDNIRVYFKPQKFGHAFYENTKGIKGAKDQFSPTRAQRMDWIKATLIHPNAKVFKGWNKDKKCYEDNRRVSVVFDDFVVVIELSLNNKKVLKGNFVTCYVADKSIGKIEASPEWDMALCLNKLKK